MKLTVFQRAKIVQAQDRAGEALQDILAPGSASNSEVASKLRVAVQMLEQCLEADSSLLEEFRSPELPSYQFGNVPADLRRALSEMLLPRP